MPKELLEVKNFQTGTVSTVSTTDISVDAASMSLNIDPSSEDGVLKGIPTDENLKNNTIHYNGSDIAGIQKPTLTTLEIRKDNPKEGDSYLRVQANGFTSPDSATIPISIQNESDDYFFIYLRTSSANYNLLGTFTLVFTDINDHTATLTFNDKTILKPGLWGELTFKYSALQNAVAGSSIVSGASNYIYTESDASFSTLSIEKIKVHYHFVQPSSDTGVVSPFFYVDIDNIKTKSVDIVLKADLMKRVSSGSRSAIVAYNSDEKEIHVLNDPEENPSLNPYDSTPFKTTSSANEVSIIENSSRAHIGTGMSSTDKTKWAGIINFPSFLKPQENNNYEIEDAELKGSTTVYEENNEGDEFASLIKVVSLNKKSGTGAVLNHTDGTHPDDYVYGISNSGIHIYRISMGLEADSTGISSYGTGGPQEQIDLNGSASIHNTAGLSERGTFDQGSKEIVSIAPSRSKIDTLLILAVNTANKRAATLYEMDLNIAHGSWDDLSHSKAWSLDFRGTGENNWRLSNRLVPTDIIETHDATDSKIWVLWTPTGSNQDEMMQYYYKEETDGECADRCLYSGVLPTTGGGIIYLDDKSPSFGHSGGYNSRSDAISFPWGDITSSTTGGFEQMRYSYCKAEKDYTGTGSNLGYTGDNWVKEEYIENFRHANYSGSDSFVLDMQGGFYQTVGNDNWDSTKDGIIEELRVPVLSPTKFSLIDMSSNYKSGANGMPTSEVKHVVGFYCKVLKDESSDSEKTVGWLEKHYGPKDTDIYGHTGTAHDTIGMKATERRVRYVKLENHNVLWVQSFENNRGLYQRFHLFGNGHHTGVESTSNKDGIWDETHTAHDTIPTGCLNFPSPNSSASTKALKLLFVNTSHHGGIANGGKIYSVTKDPDDDRVIITYEIDGKPYLYTHSIGQSTTNSCESGDRGNSAANTKELRFINGHYDDSLSNYNNGAYPAKTAQSVDGRVINKTISILPLDGNNSDGNSVHANRPIFTLRNIDYPTPGASDQYEWYLGALFGTTGVLGIYGVDLYKRVYENSATDAYTMTDCDKESVGLHLNAEVDEYFEGAIHSSVSMSPLLVMTTASNTSVVHNPATYGTSDEEGVFNTSTKYKYKTSFMYDGYQESPLSITSVQWDSSMNTETNGQNYGNDSLKIEMSYRNIPKRVTALNIYRKDGDGEYRIVKSLDESSAGYIHDVSKDLYIFTYEDNGDAQESYESRTGISEFIERSMVNYSLSTELNSQLFVAKCHIIESDFNAPTYLFKSKVGNYNQFDWSTDFLILPSVPNAISSFQGRIYVWDDNNTYKINPSTLSIEDIYEGVGCVGPEAISVTDYGMCFASRNNVYLHDGAQIQPIGDPILRSSKNPSWSHSYQNAVKQTINNGDDINITFYPKRNCFLIFLSDYISTPDANGNVVGIVGRVWSYDVSRKRWDRWDCPKVNSVVTSSYGDIIVSGTPDEADNYKIVNYLKNEDVRRTWEWDSKDFVLGQSTQDKIFRRIKVEGSVNESINSTNNTPSSTDDIRVYIDGTLSKLTKRENGSWNLDTTVKKGKKCSVAFSNQTGEVDSFGVIFRRRGAK